MASIAVIIPTYNSAASLRFALASVRAQTFEDYEVWVVGDACTDDSAAVVAETQDPRVRWVNLTHRHGSQAGPNNEGLRRSTAPLVAYLGHDDLWLPYHLETLVAKLHDTGADFVHSLCPMIGLGGIYGCVGQPRPGRSYAWHVIPPSSWLHQRALIHLVGAWQDAETLPWPVDFDIIHRAAVAGARFAHANRITLLKFPAADFRAYALGTIRPQPAYWDRITRDAARVELEVATALAGLLAQDRYGGDPPLVSIAERGGRATLRRLREHVIGVPLVASLERWRQRRLRRRHRRERGLA